MEHTVQRASGEKAEPKLSASIQGNVVSLYTLRQSGTLTVRKADGVWRYRSGGESECPTVMAGIGVETSLHPKVSRLPPGLSLQENLKNF